MFDFYNELGNSCHQRKQSQVAITVVTGLNHNDILFAHIPTTDTNWVVTGATWSLQRFWTTSTLEFTVMCAQEYVNSFMPPMPLVNKDVPGKVHTLQPEDEICIWSGYVDQLYLSVSDLPRLMEGEHPHLIRSYVGVIDTISYVGTDRGLKCTFACRDRMRYLMDTHVSLLPFDTNNSTGYMNQALGGSTSSVNRSQVILKLAQTGIGYIRLGQPGAQTPLNLYGKRIEPGVIQDIGEFIGTPGSQPPQSARINPKNFLPSDYMYNHGLKRLASSTFNRTLDLSPTPLFNIFTSRPPFNTETVTREYTLEEQIPIEIIKHLSNQEVYPTEVFSSPLDGNYYYVPRGGDMSGLNDPKRFYRTYYYRYTPPGLGNVLYLNSIKSTYGFGDLILTDAGDLTTNPQIQPKNDIMIDYLAAFATQPDYGQAVLSFKHDLTTVSMFTNFIVSNSSPNNKAEGGGDNILINMSARPAFLSGLDIAGRNKYIVDETINTPPEATAVAVNYARLHSKEVRAMQITIPGDPSLQPGEVIQVIGNPMFDHLRELPELIRERKAAYDFMARDNANYQDILKTIKDQDGVKTTSTPLPVTGNNEGPSEHIAQNPDQDAYVLGKVVKGTKSALEVLAAPYYDQSSTIIKAGPRPNPENVALDSKPNSTPAPTTSSGSGNTPALDAQGNPTPITIKTERGFYYPAGAIYRTTSPYSLSRRNPVTGVVRPHAGVDFGLPFRVPVLASSSGIVSHAGVNPRLGRTGGYGEYVVIDHGSGYQTLYGHLDSVSVRVGQYVKVGEVVGRNGSTGNSTGPHLHFEVRINGRSVEPTQYLNKDPKNQYALASAATPDNVRPIETTIPNTGTITPAVKPNNPSTPTTTSSSTETTTKQTVKLRLSPGHIVDAGTGVDFGVLGAAGLVTYKGKQYSPEGLINILTVEAAVEYGQSKGFDVSSIIPNHRLASNRRTGDNPEDNRARGEYGDMLKGVKANTGAVIIELHRDDAKGRKAFIYNKSFPLTKAEENLRSHYGDTNFEAARNFALPRRGIPILEVSPLFPDRGPGAIALRYKRAKTDQERSAALADLKESVSIDAKELIDTFFKGIQAPSAATSTDAAAPTTDAPTTGTNPPPATPGTVAGAPVPDELYKRSHFAQEPVSMFRVDAVRHNYNSAGAAGYTTEVVLLPLFGG